MSLNNNEEQKSPKRRFLLILGGVVFVGLFTMGLLLIVWSGFLPQLPKPQRTIFGAVVILYSILRFARYLRKDPNER
ncbi:hypothetical protein DYU05_12435 [Mucilaginibacter terrenus]|uniref:Uncharacterized protein n=1 Tax=Mucilaginibacter terrenus TaxID=2482727 RepID=A0A3E2NPM0_9SPHI|nr:hypothetical protein DYU05_12435 [Mucilaginibacter terrenus]